MTRSGTYEITDNTLDLAIRSPHFVPRPGILYSSTSDGQSFHILEGERSSPIQTVDDFLTAHNEGIYSGRLPARLDNYAALFAPMENLRNPADPFPASLLQKVTDFVALIFRGMPVALMPKHCEVAWKRREQTTENLLQSCGSCSWIPPKSNIIAGFTTLPLLDSPGLVQGSFLPFSRSGSDNDGDDVASPTISEPHRVNSANDASASPDSQMATSSWVEMVNMSNPTQRRNIIGISTAHLGDHNDSKGQLLRNLTKVVVNAMCKVLGMAEW